jgi:hypothetical protein
MRRAKSSSMATRSCVSMERIATSIATVSPSSAGSLSSRRQAA